MLSMGSLSSAPCKVLMVFGVKEMCWMFWCSSIGEFSFLEGNLLRQSAKTISFPGLYSNV